MKILVVGCGSIGRRHIRLLRERGAEVVGYDVDYSTGALTAQEFGVAVFGNSDDVWDCDPEGVIVATPNHMHLNSVQELFEQWPQRGYLTIRGMLVEKPIAIDSRSAQELLKVAADTPILVGYCLRFHPGLRRVKELIDAGAIGKVRHASIWCSSYLPDWRPGFDYKQGYAARRETGGGVLLDCSHELDYACWLFGKPVSIMAQVQNTGALEIKTEDIADVILRFESGVQANIHLDYLSRKPRRGCVIIGDIGTITWEFRSVGCHLDGVFQQPSDGGLGANGDPWETDDMYRAELRHFLACLRGEEKPLCTGEDGVLALRLVEAARRSSNKGLVIAL